MSNDVTAKNDVFEIGSISFLSDNALRHDISFFSHLIGHEIGNPLTTVISLISLIEQLAVNSPEKDRLQQYARTIANESWKISDIMQSAVMICSDRNLPGEPTPPEQLIRDTVSTLERRNKLGNSECLLNLRHGDARIACDRSQFSFLLSEVLKGLAALASQEEPGTGDIVVQTTAQKGYICLTCSGNTSFAQSLVLENLFNPTLARSERGVPLDFGLAAAAAIANRLGFPMRASLSGSILAITVMLPIIGEQRVQGLTQSGEAPYAIATTANSNREPGIDSFRDIIVVDDESEIRHIICKLLPLLLKSTEPLAFTEATGLELLEHAEAIACADLILIDLHLQDIDGVSLFQKLCKLHPESSGKVIFLSGARGDKRLEAEVQRSNCPVVYKPFTPDELMDAIKRRTSI